MSPTAESIARSSDCGARSPTSKHRRTWRAILQASGCASSRSSRHRTWGTMPRTCPGPGHWTLPPERNRGSGFHVETASSCRPQGLGLGERMSAALTDLSREVEQQLLAVRRLQDEVAKVVVGQRAMIDRLLLALIAD